MPKTITLVSCGAQKVDGPIEAKDLYTGPLFIKSRKYAELISDTWFILSAKYGLLEIEKSVTTYDKTLNNMKKEEIKIWADRVFNELIKHIEPGDTIIFLAGKQYRDFLLDKVKKAGCIIDIPMKGLRIGEQMQWLNEHTPPAGND